MAVSYQISILLLTVYVTISVCLFIRLMDANKIPFCSLLVDGNCGISHYLIEHVRLGGGGGGGILVHAKMHGLRYIHRVGLGGGIEN